MRRAAVHALTCSIAIDHGGEGIRYNAVLPGRIETAMADSSFSHATDLAAARAAAVERHPVGRLGRPEDIAGLVLWLASPEASLRLRKPLHHRRRPNGAVSNRPLSNWMGRGRACKGVEVPDQASLLGTLGEVALPAKALTVGDRCLPPGRVWDPMICLHFLQ